MNENINKLLKVLEWVRSCLPDDEWDKHYWKGVQEGVMRSIESITDVNFNYNSTVEELREFLKNIK